MKHFRAHALLIIICLCQVFEAGAQCIPPTHPIAGDIDPCFLVGSGADLEVYSLARQPDGKILVGGLFNNFNGVNHSSIIRLNANGTTDNSFQTGSGISEAVYAIAVLPGGKILLAGHFSTYNNQTVNGIVRLNMNGSIDNSFNPGTGFGGEVLCLIVQASGKVVVGGAFTTYNGQPFANIVRINTDGTADTSFRAGTGFNYPVRSMIQDPNGQIVVGGDFSTYNGVNRLFATRLNPDGTLDPSFNPGTGTNGGINSMVLQPDGKIVVGGGMTQCNNAPCAGVERLNTDGSRDTTFSLPYVAVGGGIINCVSLQADGKILVSGEFSTYRQDALVRIYSNGSIDTIMQSHFPFTSLVRAYTHLLQPDGKLILGGHFDTYQGQTHNNILRLYAYDSSAATESAPRLTRKLALVPNPAAGSFIIKNLDQPANLILIDAIGRVVLRTKALPEQPIHLSGIKPGLYQWQANNQEYGRLVVE